MPRFNHVTKFAASAIAAAGLMIAFALPGSAHVTVDSSSSEAGGRANLTFAFSHGCGESPTTEIAIQIPEQFNQATPAMNHGWTAEMVTEELDEPIDDGHGGQITERVSEVVYTAKEPIPDGFYDSFDIRLTLPEDAAGETIYFPVVQTCEDGESAWIEIPEEGQDGDELDYPAPSIEVTEPGS